MDILLTLLYTTDWSKMTPEYRAGFIAALWLAIEAQP
jgi:hypothetical protein